MAFRESIILADGTQGGISYEQAMRMTSTERKAAIEVIKEIRPKPKKRKGEK